MAYEAKCRRFSDRYGLSARERDVLELAMKGKNQVVIAQELFIADTTVKTHLRNVYRKVGVANRQELVRVFQDF